MILNAGEEEGGQEVRQEDLEEEVVHATPSRRSFISRLAPFANPPIRVGLADRFSFFSGTLPSIEGRTLPPLQWRAVIAGVAVAFVTALVARTLLAPVPGIAASILGVALGGYLAGKLAKSGGLYHGAVVGAGWIVLEALGLVPTAYDSPDALTDTLVVTALDVLTLLAGSAAGWLAWRGPSSSSGTGRAR